MMDCWGHGKVGLGLNLAILSMEGTGESYFTIASSPEEREAIEFLIRKASGVSATLFSAGTGTQVWGKGPLGRGFPLDQYRGRDLLMAGVGTAIAPLRSVIRSLSYWRHDLARVVVVYSVRQPQDFCFVSEMDEWRQADVDVVQTVSRPDGTQWMGRAGYAQSHLADVLKRPSRPVAFICGMQQMIDQTRDQLLRLGVAPENVLTNL